MKLTGNVLTFDVGSCPAIVGLAADDEFQSKIAAFHTLATIRPIAAKPRVTAEVAVRMGHKTVSRIERLLGPYPYPFAQRTVEGAMPPDLVAVFPRGARPNFIYAKEVLVLVAQLLALNQKSATPS